MKNEYLSQFIADLCIEDCVTQAGPVNRVEILLTPENCSQYLRDNQNKDLYFLGGVHPARGRERARDGDVRKKSHFYIDFDLRTEKPEITDADIKEIGFWLEGALGKHPFLDHWRCIAFSGNGIHVHYVGNPVDLQSVEYWREGMQYILNEVEDVVKMKPDRGCINSARLCRIPGSFNNKNGEHKQTKILLYRPEKKMDTSLIEKFGEEMIRRTGMQSGAADATSQNKSVQFDCIPVGKRNSTLTSIAGTLRNRGLDETSIFEALQAVNKCKCIPELSEREVSKIAKSIVRYQSSDTKETNVSCVPVTTCLADVESKAVSWLWQDRIPLGNLTMLEGDPGNGKSWCSLAIACHVTTGVPLPGEQVRRDPSNVLLLTAEDGMADTLRPRLEKMGADLSRIQVLTAVRDMKGEERHFSLTTDLRAIEMELNRGGYALIIIDPINAFLGAEIDTHRDAALRSVFTPLKQMVERHNIAVVCIRHLTKSSRERAIYRGQGSIAYTAAARVVHLIGVNPENSKERIIVCIKNNLASSPSALAYEITDGLFGWKGESDLTAEALLACGESGEERTAVDEAKDFLLDFLTDGAQKVKEVKTAANEAGVSERTLKRAKSALGIKAKRKEGAAEKGYWVWELPSIPKDAKHAVRETVASLDESGTLSEEQENKGDAAQLPLLDK